MKDFKLQENTMQPKRPWEGSEHDHIPWHRTNTSYIVIYVNSFVSLAIFSVWVVL